MLKSTEGKELKHNSMATILQSAVKKASGPKWESLVLKPGIPNLD